MSIRRWPAAPGRSRTVAHAGLVWTVANAASTTTGIAAQVEQSLALLDAHLREAGSGREKLLSLQVILSDIGDRPAFDAQWRAWIGDDPDHWPQRAVFQGALAPGLLVELVAVAAA